MFFNIIINSIMEYYDELENMLEIDNMFERADFERRHRREMQFEEYDQQEVKSCDVKQDKPSDKDKSIKEEQDKSNKSETDKN